MESKGEHIHLNEDPRPERLHPVFIPDDHAGTKASAQHPFPPEYTGHLGDIMIEQSKIMGRCKELATLINEDYKGQRELVSAFWTLIDSQSYQLVNNSNQ